jgi:hypothetical protein
MVTVSASSPFLLVLIGGGSNMTRIETARVREVMGFNIAAIKDAAAKLDVNSDLQELEADLSALDKSIAELKDTLVSLPHGHSS